MCSLTEADIKTFSSIPTSIFVETGSYCGNTIAEAVKCYQKVYSIELSPFFHDMCRQRFANDNRVELLLGDSAFVMESLCPKLDQPTFFWLDGHFSSGITAKGFKDCPLMEELNHIMSLFKPAAVVAIDDIRLFGTNKTEDWTDISIDGILDCVKDRLEKVEFYPSSLHPRDRMVFTLCPLTQKKSNQLTVSVGTCGGIGNHMFQIAGAYAYAKKNNLKLRLRRTIQNGDRPVYWDSILYRLTPYLTSNIGNLQPWNEDVCCVYKELPHPTEINGDGLFINGYLQSPKYYYNDAVIKEEIKELFRCEPSLLTILQNKHAFLLENRDRVVVIHARQTDYHRWKDFCGPLDGSYYRRAIERMLQVVPNPIFVLASDDNNFWKQIYDDLSSLHPHLHMILTNHTDIETIGLLQQFKYFIISNSTFSWWCAWLSNDAQHVIAPAAWYGPNGPSNHQDIYESSWEKL